MRTRLVSTIVLTIFMLLTASAVLARDPIKPALEQARLDVDSCVIDHEHLTLSAKQLSRVLNQDNPSLVAYLAPRVNADVEIFHASLKRAHISLQQLLSAINLLVEAGGDPNYAAEALKEQEDLLKKIEELEPFPTLVDDLRKSIEIIQRERKKEEKIPERKPGTKLGVT